MDASWIQSAVIGGAVFLAYRFAASAISAANVEAQRRHDELMSKLDELVPADESDEDAA